MHHRSSRIAVGLVAVSALLALGACGGTSDDENDLGSVASDHVNIYGTDGNMSNSLGDALKDDPTIINGMKGVTPLTPLYSDFKNRLRALDPNLDTFTYVGETYDAIVISALAAEAARTVDPPTIAKYVNGITTGGTQCTDFHDCVALVRQGKDIDYKGISLRRGGFTDLGEPSTATYGALSFGRDGKLDDGKTEYIGAGRESETTKQQSPPIPSAPRKPGPLKIGTLLPKTGLISSIGAGMFTAARLAIKDINDNGGVLGMPVQYTEGDDGTAKDVANATADRLIADGVHIIIGAGASGVTAAVLPKVVAAQRILFSPCNTSAALSEVKDNGLYFRTAPPDGLQAKALADIIMRDGRQRILLIARDDTYGKGLQSGVQKELQDSGVAGEHIKLATYDVKDKYSDGDQKAIFDKLGAIAKDFNADGILIIGYDESANVIKGLENAKVIRSQRS